MPQGLTKKYASMGLPWPLDLHDEIKIYVYLDECTNDTKRCQPEILERPCLADRVEERVEVQRDVC